MGCSENDGAHVPGTKDSHGRGVIQGGGMKTGIILVRMMKGSGLDLFIFVHLHTFQLACLYII